MKTDSEADEPHKLKRNGSPSKLWQNLRGNYQSRSTINTQVCFILIH